MSILSDADIRRMWPNSEPGPASLDLHIGDSLLVWPRWILRDPRIDQSRLWKPVDLDSIRDDEGAPIDEPCWILKPGNRYLAATRERIAILPTHAAQIDARSSWARDGLAVIQGPAGWIDPGFRGRIVLELSVVGSELVIWPGARVCQMIVHELTTPCERPYAGRYQGQDDVTPSRHLLVTEAVNG
jgi:deoxycytidine triphosphate deaminase